MNGIERAEKWYDNILLPAIQEKFPELLGRIAFGIVGRGSECFGFDDDISLDHDCGTGVSLWLNDADEERFGFALMRFYNALHKQHFPVKSAASKLGYCEHGVTRISDFYRRHLGFPRAPECWQEWFYTPEYAFAEVVNGKVFRDDANEFSRIRDTIRRGFPADVQRKKIAGCAVMMAQSGQYNFDRCLKHGERAAAMMALTEFVRYGIMMIFLLNNTFMPYYKWMFRAARQLPRFNRSVDDLAKLLTADLKDDEKIDVIEKICADTVAALTALGLTSGKESYLEPHAFAVAATVVDPELREMHIMEM